MRNLHEHHDHEPGSTSPTRTTGPGRPLRGALIRPGDPGYDEARAVYNGMIDKRPAAIARCRDVADVIALRAVRPRARRSISRCAAAATTPPASASGTTRWSSTSRCMRSTTVEPGRRARCASTRGCTWGDVDHATGAFGLATPSGFIASTGVGGLTLGGGVGYLTRRFGLTVDNLLAADVVLADGTFVTASDPSHPDLFWALRGGGGNFGIVTSFTFRCQRGRRARH